MQNPSFLLYSAYLLVLQYNFTSLSSVTNVSRSVHSTLIKLPARARLNVVCLFIEDQLRVFARSPPKMLPLPPLWSPCCITVHHIPDSLFGLALCSSQMTILTGFHRSCYRCEERKGKKDFIEHKMVSLWFYH